MLSFMRVVLKSTKELFILNKFRPISEDDVECEESCEEKENIRKTPIKNRLTEHAGVEGDHAEVRRSPRKHPGSKVATFD